MESPRDAVGGTAGAVTTVAEEKEEKELGRAQQPNAFTSFAWHPSKEKVIVAVLSNGEERLKIKK